MSGFTGQSTIGAAIIALLTVAFIATGFGHRIPDSGTLAAQAYVMAGGDLSDLCGDPATDGKTAHRDCPACHIVSAALLPEKGATIIAVEYAFRAEVLAPQVRRAAGTALDPLRSQRAPPLV